MTDSSVPLWDSEEENGLTALTLRRMSWEALIETGTLPGHAALGVQDHEAGEAAVDCRPNQPCLDPGDHTGQGDGRVLVNHTCSGDPGECGGIPPPVQCQGLGDKRISDKSHKKKLVILVILFG